MSETLHVQERSLFGKRHNRRLRKSGKLPAVLYGHGQDPVSLSVPSEEFAATLRHGAKVVDLDGAAKGQALLQDVQWDTFFKHVLHVDLLRVEAGDTVTVTVPVELRGEAPGTNVGGHIDQLIHELELEVTPANVPEKLHVNINHLELDQLLTVSDIEDMPEGAEVHAAPDDVIVQCIQRAEEPDEEAVSVGEVEPEVIGQRPEDAEDEGQD